MFGFQLARDFGRVDVKKFLSELDPDEFLEWWAAYAAMGWGCETKGIAGLRADEWNRFNAENRDPNRLPPKRIKADDLMEFPTDGSDKRRGNQSNRR